ncbi:MAG: SDR family NAD(P)-dependent oxidoreductase [Acidimicrobiales bacterium]
MMTARTRGIYEFAAVPGAYHAGLREDAAMEQQEVGHPGEAGLAGKVGLVSGAASGIGLASARRLRQAGATVAVLDIDRAAGQAAAEEMGGGYHHVDVGLPGRWAAAVAAIEAEHGGLDFAYLNAGVGTNEADLTKVSDEQYRRIMGANVDGVFFGARAVVPAIHRRGGGAIVATASLAGLIAYSPDPVYAMTKSAVVGLVRALAPQLASKGITINAICPGLVDTPLLGPQLRAIAAAAEFPLIPVTDIAEAVYQRVVGAETGQAWVCQVGREPLAYRFAGVPGPRGGVAGRTPPPGLAADEELRKGS